MNKKITLFLMAALLALNSVGQTDTLYINLASHYSSSYGLEGVRKLTFTETELNVAATNGSIKTVAFGNIESLTFSRKYADEPQNEVPNCALLISPANGAANVPVSAILSWNIAPKATSYDVYFGTSANPAFAANTTGTSYSPTLALATTYYWKVIAKSAAGEATGCETRSFTTAPTVGLTEIERKTTRIFPNPVTDFLTVESETPVSEITVFDLTGRVVLHDMTRRQGAIVSFQNCPASVYFIQIITEKEKIVKQIIKH